MVSFAMSAQHARAAAQPDATRAASFLRDLTGRPSNGHDWYSDVHLEWSFNEFLLALTILP
jgi:hypothetical protein